MAIKLVDTTVPAYASKDGAGTFYVAGGKTLKIETMPAGEEILNVTVPDGKTWQVHIRLDIVES